MADCDRLIGGKGKVVYKREGVGKENKGMKTFHGLRVISPMHTCTTVSLERRHLPYQVRP